MLCFCTAYVLNTKLIVIYFSFVYVGRGSLPVPQRNGLHDGIQSSSGAERVRPDVPIIPRIPIAPNTRINVQLTSVCCFQSRCHGLLLRLHLGRHHPGVPHTYPSTKENSVCVCVCERASGDTNPQKQSLLWLQVFVWHLFGRHIAGGANPEHVIYDKHDGDVSTKIPVSRKYYKVITISWM